jgi:hypothetical protein
MRFGIASIAKWNGSPPTPAGKQIINFHSGRLCRATTLGKASNQPHLGTEFQKWCNAKPNAFYVTWHQKLKLN